MIQEFDFFRTPMPETRKADYHLGCLDGSIFLDFDKSGENLVSLVRISFDGYGCCNLNEKAKFLDKQDSDLFIAEMNNENLNQVIITYLVLKAIQNNKDIIWNDALLEYKLIDNK